LRKSKGMVLNLFDCSPFFINPLKMLAGTAFSAIPQLNSKGAVHISDAEGMKKKKNRLPVAGRRSARIACYNDLLILVKRSDLDVVE